MDPNPQPPPSPAVSPTGAPMVSAKLTPYLLALFTIATTVAGASQIPALHLPSEVFGYATLAALVLGGLLGITPGLRKAAPMVLLFLAVGLGASCAHADAIVVTKDTIHATRLAAQATAAGMKSADDQHLLTAKEVQRWNLFLKRFNALFHVAADTWDAAADVHDEDASTQAAAILAKLMVDLGSFAIDLAAPAGGGS